MGAIVSYEYYSTVYKGQEADEVSFPALSARAEDIIGAMARWAVTEDSIDQYPAQIQTLYKKAVCAQVDCLAVNGLDSVAGGSDRGFTVGKVSMSGKSGSDITGKGAMAECIAPMALMYLEQTGLMRPAVAVGPLYAEADGWWI